MSTKAAAISALGKEVLAIFNGSTANAGGKIQLPAVPQVFPGYNTGALTAPCAERAAALLERHCSGCSAYQRRDRLPSSSF